MAVTLGQVIENQFKVEAHLASGGMGSVYRVWDLKRGVQLAMKVLHGNFAEDPVMFRRFQREARTLQKLAHPHIVPFYGFVQTPEIAFLLEKYIEGPSLEDLINKQGKRPLPAETILTIFQALCSALGYAHSSQNQVIHCDIKPANVLIDQSGQVYLADFGIARHAESTTTTLAGAGTVAYMAPEQVQLKRLTPQTDIYSLGVILFELFTGVKPFTGVEPGIGSRDQTAAEKIRYAHVNLLPPDPSQINRSLSPAIRSVILKALEKDPNRRYKTTLDLYMALCDAVGSEVAEVPDRIQLALPVKNIPPPIVYQGQPPVVVPGYIPIPSQPRSKSTLPLILAGAGLFIIMVIGVGIGIANANKGVKLTFPVSSGNNQPSGNNLDSAQGIPEQPLSGSNPSGLIALQPTETFTTQSFTPTLPAINMTDTNPEYFPISGCHASRLHVGQYALAAYQNFLNLRSYADTHPSDNIIGKVPNGEMVEIIGGPECNYGWVLWYVRTLAGLEGWIAETDDRNYLMTPVKFNLQCGIDLGSRLVIGDTAFVIADASNSSNVVRESPSKDSKKITTIQPGGLMTILEGPQCAGGFVWWKVKELQYNKVGWTVERDMNSFWIAPQR